VLHATIHDSRWRLECNNFASSRMSQNHTQWNLDFHFPLATLFLACIILLYIIDNEHKLAPHLFEQHETFSGMDVSITFLFKSSQ
jgi:hypothetical protein